MSREITVGDVPKTNFIYLGEQALLEVGLHEFLDEILGVGVQVDI